MKKRLLSLAMVLCMVLTLLPTTAFADENAETPVCTCEEACTAEKMNAECAVCGAEGAVVENCCKYAVPATEAQTEVTETEETDPETSESEEVDPEATESEEVDSETTESEVPVCN